MILEMWRNILSCPDLPQPFTAEDDIDEVVSIMMEFQIDVARFTGNWHHLMTEGMPPLFESVHQIDRFPTTESVREFTLIVDRPLNVPLWLLAGFPDVMKWFGEQEDRLLDAHADEVEEAEQMARILRTDLPTLAGMGERELLNANGQLRAKYYRNMIRTYKHETGQSPEAAVLQGTEEDIYLGMELVRLFGEESNFTLIAGMTTKYYLELKKSYWHRFPDETSLLTVAGILDAHDYVLRTGDVSAAQIAIMAKETEGMPERLLQFVVRLEALLLHIDAPDFMSDDVVGQACEDQMDSIRQAIERTMSSYSCDPELAAGVQVFMTSRRFSGMRAAAGVRREPLWRRIRRALLG